MSISISKGTYLFNVLDVKVHTCDSIRFDYIKMARPFSGEAEMTSDVFINVFIITSEAFPLHANSPPTLSEQIIMSHFCISGIQKPNLLSKCFRAG